MPTDITIPVTPVPTPVFGYDLGLLPEPAADCLDSFDRSTFNDALNGAHRQVEETALGLFKKDNFTLKGPAYATRWGKFSNTVKTFTQASGAVGAGLSSAVLLPADLVTGQSGESFLTSKKSSTSDEPVPTKPPLSGFRKFLNEGIAGFAVKIPTGVASVGVGETIKLVGTTVGIVTSPAGWALNGDPKTHVKVSGEAAYKYAGKEAAYLTGSVGGLALTLARLPSLIVKQTVTGACALTGGIIGVLAGAIRAAANK